MIWPNCKTGCAKTNKPLNLFAASFQKPKAQWPERNSQDAQPELKAVSQLIRVRLFEADQLAEQRKFKGAAHSLKKASS